LVRKFSYYMSDITQPVNDSAAADLVVVQRVLAGEVNAYAVLESKYKRIVAFLVRKMISNEEDAADIVQDTFVKAFSALKTYKGDYPFSRWLYKIASNKCIDYLRRKRFAMVSIDSPIATKDGGEMTFDPMDLGPVPVDIVLANERSAMLKNALQSLPEKYRNVIRMRHEEDLEYQEIADKLAKPLGTVKAHIFRARKLLYKRLLKHGDHFEEYMPDVEEDQ